MNNTDDIVQRRDDAQFQTEMESLSREAESRRFEFMTKYRNRRFVFMTVSILSISLGASAFGWFLLMRGDILTAVASMTAAIILPVYLHFWTEGPIKVYRRDYKTSFMPKIAKALGGLRFHETRGISMKILGTTGVVPKHDSYEAEDCFMGVYKGIKVIMSEATLTQRGRFDPVFRGLFVMLELQEAPFAGHTILTADSQMADHYAKSRWAKLQPVTLTTDNPDWNRFRVYSDKPDSAAEIVQDRLLKELYEAGKIFDDAVLTAVLFKKKFVFLMIPSRVDMFEASDMFVPVPIKQHALKCKKEIEQILEVIDVFELYLQNHPAPAPTADGETGTR